MEWKEDIAADFCSSVTDGTHDSPKATINGKKLITSKHLKDGYIDFESAKFISEKDYLKVIERSKVDQFDILFSMIGTIGNIYRETSPNIEYAVKNMGIFKMGGNAIRSKWLYYWLKSKEAHAYIYERMAGSTQSYLTLDSLRKFPVVYPEDINDMENIVSILSSLDRKIELNNKINADLEEMAQAIFKNWFVDFEPFKDGKFVDSELGMIPEGWKVGKITDIGCLITDYVSNGSFASLKQNVHLYETKEYAQFIRNTDLKTNTFSVYVDKHSYDFLSKSTLYGNEIIISNVGDVGSVHLCPKLDIPMTLGNNIIMLRPNEKEYNYFLYLWFKYFSGQGLIQGIKGGSAQPKFNKTDFKNLPLLIPSFEIIERSYWIFESMFSILSSNVKENSRLSLLRDTLLPRLMSGEIEIPE